MGYKDALLMDDGIAVTTTAVYSDVIDQLAASDAYESCWLVVRTDVAFADSGTSLTASLETSDTEIFTSATTLVVGPAVLKATLMLDAGQVLLKVRIPIGALRYLRVKLTNSGTLATGTVAVAIMKDIDVPLA